MTELKFVIWHHLPFFPNVSIGKSPNDSEMKQKDRAYGIKLFSGGIGCMPRVCFPHFFLEKPKARMHRAMGKDISDETAWTTLSVSCMNSLICLPH